MKKSTRKQQEELLDWIYGVAHSEEPRFQLESFADVKRRFPQSVKRHLAIAKALLEKPPHYLVEAWKERGN